MAASTAADSTFRGGSYHSARSPSDVNLWSGGTVNLDADARPGEVDSESDFVCWSDQSIVFDEEDEIAELDFSR